MNLGEKAKMKSDILGESILGEVRQSKLRNYEISRQRRGNKTDEAAYWPAESTS